MNLDTNYMTQYIKRLTGVRFLSVLAALVLLTACEKNIDNTLPPDANKFSDDVKNAFANLTDDERLWFWDLSSPLTDGHLMSAFYKDSTVESYLMQRYTVLDQLYLLYSTAGLPTADRNEVATLYNTFAPYDDATLRLLMDNPANASFKNRLLKWLPNYTYFNGYYTLIFADEATFNMNGPVQLSLTINNSTLLTTLRQTRQLDYDFRILSNTKDHFVLSGYYSNSSNQNCELIPMANAEALPAYANGSALFMSALLRRANVSVKVNGNTVTVPAAYRSGIDLFYRSFADGIMNKEQMVFTFESLQPAAADLPEEFRDIEFCVVKAHYDGSYTSAPSGQAFLTMEGYTTGGSKKTIEFIKP